MSVISIMIKQIDITGGVLFLTKDGSILKKIEEMDESDESIFPTMYLLKCVKSPNEELCNFDNILYTMDGVALLLTDEISDEFYDNIAITEILDDKLYPEYMI